MERIGLGCSGSGAGALGRFAGAVRGALSEGEGNKSVLGVGWLVTDEEVNNGVWQGVAVISSTRDSAVKNSDQKQLETLSKCQFDKKITITHICQCSLSCWGFYFQTDNENS